MRYPCYWTAVLANGNVVREADGHNFKTLPKEEVIRFLLEGPGVTAEFLTTDGLITVNGETLAITIDEINGGAHTYPLMGRRDVSYNDLIQYKDAETSLSINRRGTPTQPRNRLLQYNIGYKTTGISDIFGQWWFKNIIHVPVDSSQPIHATLRFVSEKGFRAKSLIARGKRRAKVNMITQNKVASEISVMFGV